MNREGTSDKKGVKNMKENIRYKVIFFIIVLIQLCLFNTYLSFAIETEKEQIIPDGTYVIKTVLDEKYALDVDQVSKKNEANIQLFEYVEENQQKFKVKYIGDGYYHIMALHSGKALSIAKAEETTAINVYQYELNDSDEQKWTIKDAEDGYYNIVSKCNDLYLNVDSKDVKNKTNIEVNTENGTDTQRFKFEEVSENEVEQKQIIEDGTYVIRTILNKKYALDVNQVSKKNGANIQLFEYVEEDQQKFNLKHIGDGYYTITALHSGKALDVASAGKTPGTNVWQYELNNSNAQKWLIKDAGNGNYNIISKCNGLYLDVTAASAKNGANIQVYTGNGTNAQKFKLEKIIENVQERTIEDGIYAIKTLLNDKYSLDVSEASKANGANIQLFQYAKEYQQKFKVKYLDDGYYTITALHSGKALDVASAGKTPGTNVWQYELNNSNAQKWLIKDAGNGNYNIISKCNGLYLDVTAASAKNKSNIQVYTGNGTNAQKFKFVETSICEEGTYGKSGLAVKGDSRGTDLKYYQIGQGKNVMFATFSIHGFEDSYDHDGAELTYIAEQFKEHLIKIEDKEILNNWTIYIFPTLNPDGQTYGTTNNGEGRTTLYSAAPNNKGIDMNRNFKTSDYVTYTDDRNYNGTEAFQAYEARYLRDFLLSNKSKNGQTILVDLHGWLEETMGDNELGEFYRNEFELTKHISTYGRGYLINWARMSLGNSNKTARSVLVELPQVNSHEELVSEKHAEKYIDATINMLKSLI